MRMVVLIVDADHASDIERLLDDCDAPGYTQIESVHGKGRTGKKAGSRAFPGSSSLFIAALDDHCIEPLRERLHTLRSSRGPEEGLKAFIMDTEELT